jgi:hypothetical protein
VTCSNFKPLVGILGDVDGRIVPVAPPPVLEFKLTHYFGWRPRKRRQLSPRLLP